MRVVSGHQPTYLPWLGLFHKIALADVFVFMDDVQYLRQDWNNRNRIKGPQGSFWLTVPVRLGSSSRVPLKDVRVVDDGWGSERHWQQLHWRSIQGAYARTPHWSDVRATLEPIYLQRPWRWLAELNSAVLRGCLDLLGIEVQWIQASGCSFVGRKSDLVLEHCQRFGGDVCVVGTHGRDYVVQQDFLRAGVSLYFQNYVHPEYSQRFGPFVSHLSIIDLLCNCGPQSRTVLMSHNMQRSGLQDACQRLPQPGLIAQYTLGTQVAT